MSVEIKRFGVVFVVALAMLFGQQAMAKSLPDFTELAADNGAAVVNISTKQKVKRSHRFPKNFDMPDIPEGSPFEDFFRRFSQCGVITQLWIKFFSLSPHFTPRRCTCRHIQPSRLDDHPHRPS